MMMRILQVHRRFWDAVSDWHVKQRIYLVRDVREARLKFNSALQHLTKLQQLSLKTQMGNDVNLLTRIEALPPERGQSSSHCSSNNVSINVILSNY